MMYHLSIITVCLNNANGLTRTMNSIVPLPKNCEWIIIDGQSTDDTIKILKSLPKADNIKWISEPDGGIFDAMNKGIKMAHGLFLNFLNSGDYYERVNFLKILDTLSSAHEDIMVYDYYPVSEKLMPSYSRTFNTNIKNIEKHNCIHHQSTLIHSRIFYEIGGYDLEYRYTADYEFFARAYKNGIKFSFFKGECLSYFVQDGVTSNLKLALIQGRENKKIQEKYFNKFSKRLYASYLIRSIIYLLPLHNEIYKILRKILLKKKNYNVSK